MTSLDIQQIQQQLQQNGLETIRQELQKLFSKFRQLSFADFQYMC